MCKTAPIACEVVVCPEHAEKVRAADFVRFFVACRLAAEALALANFHQQASAATAVALNPWPAIGGAFDLGPDAEAWMERQGQSLMEEALGAFGSPIVPDVSSMGRLLAQSKITSSSEAQRVKGAGA
mmetsp:Transcript_181825/g.577101  ORF Transcript_181825/g.577101 Transcript_181825/m.577101 type:complete len:127 (+) Transcript_181825:1037-1417(+)